MRPDISGRRKDFKSEYKRYVPEASSIGPIVPGYALPRPCRSSPRNAVYGVAKRLGGHTAVYDADLLDDIKRTADEYVRRHYVPLRTVQSVREWIEGSNYTGARRRSLTKLAISLFDGDMGNRVCHIVWSSMARVKAFIKAESYKEFKSPRIICSRSDYSKLFYGPIAKSIESVVYQDDHFIKHVPVIDRAGVIAERFGRNGVVLESDFSSFECHFTRDLMLACEMVLYRYMLSRIKSYHGLDLSSQRGFDEMFGPILGVNSVHLSDFVFDIPATRMSGECFTSLGNGFSNFIIMSTILKRFGVRLLDFVVEGDDGLYLIDERDVDKVPTQADFQRLGFSVKLDLHPSVNRASFCGMVFNAETRHCVKDPYATLVKFGWTDKPYVGKQSKARGLLRAKAFSLLYEVPYCPILSDFARRVLELTEDYRPDFSRTSYHGDRDYASQVADFSCNYKERLGSYTSGDVHFFCDLYGLEVIEVEDIVREIRSCNELDLLLAGPIFTECLRRHAPRDWVVNWNRFVRFVGVDKDVDSAIARNDLRVDQDSVDPVYCQFRDRNGLGVGQHSDGVLRPDRERNRRGGNRRSQGDV